MRLLLCASLLLTLAGSTSAAAQTPESHAIATQEFQNVWDRTEAPVAAGLTSRSWLWGPEPRSSGLQERYLESPDLARTIQYFDKGRMEINDPSANPSDPWYVTSGLLTREMISGEIQIGDEDFLDTGSGASIQIAGDHKSPFPLYRDLADIIDTGEPDRVGERAVTVLTPDGLSGTQSPPDDPNATFVEYVVYHGPDGHDVGYNIPRAFWDYMNAPGVVFESGGTTSIADPLFSWVFVMGLPISDPFWAEVTVSTKKQWVLIQPFERRVLTYTPLNEEAWQVEMGNIGQHYQDWRSSFFTPPVSGGDPAFYALQEEESWRYGTSYNVDEIWRTLSTDSSFVPGHELFVREELKLEGRRLTYWSVGEDGAYLHGWDVRDGQGNIRSMVVYSPAIHILPPEREPGYLTTNTTAISMLHPPESKRIEVLVGPQDLVSTPAGLFRAWRLDATTFDEVGLDHRLGFRYWFEPETGIVQWIDNGFSAYLISSSTLND